VPVKYLTIFFALFGFGTVKAQDTFSILAFDSITGEVGAAGASCVDLFQFTGYTNDFITELFPGEGAIATQASYLSTNQLNARAKFLAGDSPTQLISWLAVNDVQSLANAQFRQYGVVRMNKGYPMSAAFTGTNCMNYKNHITRANYAIQGNILLGQLVLDSMEAGFNREKGDLACKLMSAMQGAKMIGADTRCAANGSSSLFAFLKVSLPADTFGSPSFLVSLKTPANAGIEPIDSLQKLFNTERSCDLNPVTVKEKSGNNSSVQIFPNPAKDRLIIRTEPSVKNKRCIVRNSLGKTIVDTSFQSLLNLDTVSWERGMFFIEIKTDRNTFIRKLILN
jgi:uncharacterized Ntn-hydrolase superfamily protein